MAENPPAPHLPAGADVRRFAHRLVRLFADRHLWLMLLLIIPAMLPLAAPGYFFNAHDGRHSVFYLLEFDRAIRDGILWPTWSPDHALGFGYPFWLVYAPLAYFVAELFHLLGFGLTAAVKLAWALGFLVGAVGMYRLARRWWGQGAGLIAGLAYTYAPYHFVDIYVRGAFAEFMALAWFPWVLLAFVNLWDDPRPRRAAWAALALGALLLTHSQAPVMYMPVLGGFVLFKLVTFRPSGASRGARPRSVLWSGAALTLGLLLGAVFLAPLVLERRFVADASWLHDTYYYGRHFVYPSQFFNTGWGFGYSVEGPNDGMSFQLGLLQVLGAVAGALAALGAFANRGWRLSRRADAVFLVAVSLLTIFAMTPAAQSIWDVLPMVNLIQFPWRLLALSAVTLALLAGAAAGVRRDGAGDLGIAPPTVPARSRGPYLYVAALALVLASFSFTRPELSAIRPQDESPLAIVEYEAQYPDMRGMMAWSARPPADGDSPLVAQYLAGEPLTRAAIVAGQGTILDQGNTSATAYARVRAVSGVRLRFYTYYFPGWQATVDGLLAVITPDPPNGLIGLDLPPGDHEVRLRFGATPVRRVGAALSLAGLAFVVALRLIGRRRGRR